MGARFKKSEMEITEFLEERYGHLNNGMQRMNIGNLLRGAISRCSKVKETEDVEDEDAK